MIVYHFKLLADHKQAQDLNDLELCLKSTAPKEPLSGDFSIRFFLFYVSFNLNVLYPHLLRTWSCKTPPRFDPKKVYRKSPGKCPHSDKRAPFNLVKSLGKRPRGVIRYIQQLHHSTRNSSKFLKLF